MATAPEQGVFEIFVLYLDPMRRGEGIGTLLLDAITEQQRAQGAREQWVSVEPENMKGLPFYYARGFEVRGKRPNGAPRRRKAVFLFGSCDDSSPNDEAQPAPLARNPSCWHESRCAGMQNATCSLLDSLAQLSIVCAQIIFATTK